MIMSKKRRRREEEARKGLCIYEGEKREGMSERLLYIIKRDERHKEGVPR
jgi:hypothetical protein